jgi:hypothetical protein
MSPHPILVLAQHHAQVAVAVELYTIPLYLSAAASLKDHSHPAYAPIISVCTEEMLHLQLAANMCLALGTTPNFTAPVFGKAPTFPNGTPILDPRDPVTGDAGILDATIGNLVDTLPVMLDIEVPTEFEHAAIVPPYHSIGQMYGALKVLARMARRAAPWTTTHQVVMFNPKGGTQAFPQQIGNYGDLVAAVEVICEQGEGKGQSPPPRPPYTPEEFMVPDDGDRLVGWNSDPPALAQLSHFGRFLAIKDAGVSAGDVYTGTAAPSSAANQKLQQDFAALITTLNQVWSGQTSSGALWSMTALLTDVTNVWVAGNIPQWSP